MSIVVNKVDGICVVVVLDIFLVCVICEYNNSNVFCLGECVIGEGLVFLFVDIWFEVLFVGDCYKCCLDKIIEFERK